MANAPEAISRLWKKLEEARPAVPASVWQVWEAECLGVLDEIVLIVEQNKGASIPVKDAEAMGKRAERLQKFVRGIKRSGDGLNALGPDGAILLEDTIRDLVAHYLGNDIYKISLIVDVYGAYPQPLPEENGGLILRNIAAIKAFTNQLKARTK